MNMTIIDIHDVITCDEVLLYCSRLDIYTLQEMQRDEDRRNGCNSNRYRCLQLLQELALRAQNEVGQMDMTGKPRLGEAMDTKSKQTTHEAEGVFQFVDSSIDELVRVSCNEEAVLQISNQDGPLVSIAKDGTVTIHRDGGETEAAKIFYQCVAEQYLDAGKKIEHIRAYIRGFVEDYDRRIRARQPDAQSQHQLIVDFEAILGKAN